MTIAEYKRLTGKTNRELAEEFKAIQPMMDEPLVSRIINGVVEPSAALSEYVDDASAKVFDSAELEVYRPKDLTPLEGRIFDYLKHGSRMFPVGRQELVAYTGINDRKVRELIASIRRKGGRVCTSSQHYGYWLAKDAYDYRELRREYVARIKSLSQTLKSMDGVLVGQLEWEEELG